MAIKKDLFREWYLENCLTEPFLKSMNISHFFMERDDSGHPACFLEVAKEPIDNYQSNYFLTSLPHGSHLLLAPHASGGAIYAAISGCGRF